MQNKNVLMNPVTGHVQHFGNRSADVTSVSGFGDQQKANTSMQTRDIDFDPIMVGDIAYAPPPKRYKGSVRIRDNKGLAALVAGATGNGDGSKIDVDAKYAELIKNFAKHNQASSRVNFNGLQSPQAKTLKHSARNYRSVNMLRNKASEDYNEEGRSSRAGSTAGVTLSRDNVNS